MSEFVPIIFHVGWQVFQILVSTESSMSSGEGQFPSAVRCSPWQMNEEPFPFIKSVFLIQIAAFVYLQLIRFQEITFIKNNFHNIFHEKVYNNFLESLVAR